MKYINIKENRRDLIITLSIVLISLITIFIVSTAFNSYSTEGDGVVMQKAKIKSIENVEEEKNWHTEDYFTETKIISFEAIIKGDDLDGETVEAAQTIDTMYAMQEQEVEVGDNVLLVQYEMPGNDSSSWVFSGYNRINTLLILIGVFLVVLIIIGKRQGITTVISLGLICLAVFLVYIPAIIAGVNIYLATSVVGLYIVLMSLLIIGGANKKTLSAILGNIGGVIIAAVIAYYMNDILKMTGYIDETYANLKTNDGDPLNLVALVWSGIVLGSMGAIMDVAMSIASAMKELGEHMKDRTFLKLVKSGMNIGRDAIGTMTNTLILAYMGGSLALVILFMVNTKDVNFLFSLEVIVEQIIQSVVGSLGILFAVPFTAIFSAWLFNKEEQMEVENDSIEPKDFRNY